MIENALKLIEEHKFIELARLLKEENAADIAVLLGEVDETALPLVYRILPKELAAETFVEMEPDRQELLIRSFSDRELREMLDELFLDDTVDIIEEMPAGVVKRILKNTDAETRRSINEILQYPEDSAGTIMTIEYVDLKRNMTVTQAFDLSLIHICSCSSFTAPLGMIYCFGFSGRCFCTFKRRLSARRRI